MSDLTAVAVLFACSLVAAFVLFKILESTAAIQKKEYQVGGAAAGFLVIYAALYGSYAQLQKSSQNSSLATCQAKLDSNAALLAADENELPIQGIVEPPVRDATVVLAVKQVTLGDDGRFGLRAKGVNPATDPLSLYVITGNTHSYYQIFPADNVSDLRINVRGN